MILAGHQPEYLPYIGFFNKMTLCDKFILVDHVQFLKKSWQNRNRIRGANGEILLTVPVLTKGKFYQKINEVEINNKLNWSEKHWKSISYNYSKAPFFDSYKGFFEELYSKKWGKLVDLNESIIKHILSELKINAKIIRSSEINPQGTKTDMLIDMCKKLNADTYLSGEGGGEYVEESKFEENGLNHVYRDFHHPVYNQLFRPFIPNMSVIDLMFNYGNERGREIIQKSGGIKK